MVIVIVSPWFSDTMGYAENYLPKALSDLGCEVHLVTSNLQIYATDEKLYKDVYEPILGPPIVETGIKMLNGFTLHRLKHYFTGYGIGLLYLEVELNSIKPDIVYLFEINTEDTLQVIKHQSSLNYRIFAESRLHLSVYNPPISIKAKLRHFIREWPKWKRAGNHFEKCYPVAPDVMYVITKYFGQSKNKCSLSSLAVDTAIFKPIQTEEEELCRIKLRNNLGFKADDIVCIYTGRFTADKGPIILARAINHLQKIGETSFIGLFIGAGDETYKEDITNCLGCIIHPFVQSVELVKFYQASDIGVWPMQESTSQLDAASCGLPIIISSHVEDLDRISGNGISYEQGDFSDLAIKLLQLKAKNIRKRLGSFGSDKVNRLYSWKHIAELRLLDFKKSLRRYAN